MAPEQLGFEFGEKQEAPKPPVSFPSSEKKKTPFELNTNRKDRRGGYCQYCQNADPNCLYCKGRGYGQD